MNTCVDLQIEPCISLSCMIQQLKQNRAKFVLNYTGDLLRQPNPSLMERLRALFALFLNIRFSEQRHCAGQSNELLAGLLHLPARLSCTVPVSRRINSCRYTATATGQGDARFTGVSRHSRGQRASPRTRQCSSSFRCLASEPVSTSRHQGPLRMPPRIARLPLRSHMFSPCLLLGCSLSDSFLIHHDRLFFSCFQCLNLRAFRGLLNQLFSITWHLIFPPFVGHRCGLHENGLCRRYLQCISEPKYFQFPASSTWKFSIFSG